MSVFDVLKPLKPALAPFEFVGKKVSKVVNAVLLTIAYFTAFGVTAAFAKIFKKKFLELKLDEKKKSYWMDRKKEDYGKKEAYRAF